MNIDPALTNLLAEFGGQIGLPALALDADGATALAFDGGVQINFQYRADADALWLITDLGVPASGPAVYEDLLKGNHFWHATLGATLSLSGDETPRVILTLPIGWRGLNGARLARIMETYLNTIRAWSEVIAAPSDDDDAPADAADIGAMIRI